MKSKSELWIKESFGEVEFDVLNLDHPEVEARVIAEMDSGVGVYYDTRWGATSIFSLWLGENGAEFSGKRVFAIGAGVGFENLLLARSADQVTINDFAPVSVELCAEQLTKNGLTNFDKLPGDFTTLPLPDFDIAVGCYIIYNNETHEAVEKFLDRYDGEIILVNERLKAFRQFLTACERPFETIFEEESAIALRFFKR
ncbi:protein N-lysine methyltransferase family protein [bacterium]|nr:protein N-lysine methyltransferase family protein [bacterium]